MGSGVLLLFLVVLLDPLRMAERRSNFALGQLRAVVAFNQQRDAAAAVDVPRPAEGLVEQAEFLVKPTLLLERWNHVRAGRATVNPVGHVHSPDADAEASGLHRRLPRHSGS